MSLWPYILYRQDETPQLQIHSADVFETQIKQLLDWNKPQLLDVLITYPEQSYTVQSNFYITLAIVTLVLEEMSGSADLKPPTISMDIETHATIQIRIRRFLDIDLVEDRYKHELFYGPWPLNIAQLLLHNNRIKLLTEFDDDGIVFSFEMHLVD